MLRNLRRVPSLLFSAQTHLKFPTKFKGTIVEKWADYWKNLIIDYRQMLQELRTDMQDDPRKALVWSTGIAVMYALSKNTPNEIDYKDNMKRITNEAILVSEECRNFESIEHLRQIQAYYNEGVIHYKNFGIVSFMYVTELSNSCDLYKTHCSYLQPTYLSILSRIIDVGFMGKWWNIFIKTNNYDIKNNT